MPSKKRALRRALPALAVAAMLGVGSAGLAAPAHADVPQTSTIAATIPVGKNPQDLKFNRSGSRAYVANLGSSSVSVINTTTKKVIATVPTAASPRHLAVNRAGTRVYVESEDAQNNGTVTVIDATRNVAIGRISVGKYPGPLETSKDGRYLYVAHLFGLSVVDTSTNRIAADIPLPGVPRELLVNEAGTRLYATGPDGNAGDVLVVDITKNALAAKVHTTYEPGEIALAPGGAQLYVGGGAQDSFTVITTATNTIAKTVKYAVFGPQSAALALSPNGRHLYTHGSGFAVFQGSWFTTIYDVDPATGKGSVLSNLTGRVGSLTANPWGSGLYATFPDRNTVTVVALHPANLTAAPAPTVAGTAAKGQRLTARAGIWNPAPVTLRYQWKRNGLNVSGATGATYLLGAADVGKTMTVTVTGSKAGYTTLARTSAKTRVVTAR
ncbi:YncE family protein [Arthrobacter sp. NPDC057013]|uniref:YncE family protein n=1 Tax=Arthrobacter sp. NPDC057013 TaxID=3345999 RepID=UPI003637E129